MSSVGPPTLTHLIAAERRGMSARTGADSEAATAAQAQEAHAHIRRRLRDAWGEEAAAQCRVIYGGSVKPGNVRELVTQPDVDGGLVGGASLDVNAFAEIVAKSRPEAP